MNYCQGDVISSDDGGTSEEDGPGTPSSDRGLTPKRVLIFTSLTLLSLLSLAKYRNIDGTLKSQSCQWKQLFVVIGKTHHILRHLVWGPKPDLGKISELIQIHVKRKKEIRMMSQNIQFFWEVSP